MSWSDQPKETAEAEVLCRGLRFRDAFSGEVRFQAQPVHTYYLTVGTLFGSNTFVSFSPVAILKFMGALNKGPVDPKQLPPDIRLLPNA